MSLYRHQSIHHLRIPVACSLIVPMVLEVTVNAVRAANPDTDSPLCGSNKY